MSLAKFALGASALVLTACMGGESLEERRATPTLHFGHPKSASCDLIGSNIVIKKRANNVLGRGFVADGDMADSTIVCTDETGVRTQTISHRALFARSTYVQGTTSNVSAGVHRFSGVTTLGRSQFEFSGDLVWSRF